MACSFAKGCINELGKKPVHFDKREYQKTSTWPHHFDFKPKYLTLKYLNNYQFELSTYSSGCISKLSSFH